MCALRSQAGLLLPCQQGNKRPGLSPCPAPRHVGHPLTGLCKPGRPVELPPLGHGLRKPSSLTAPSPRPAAPRGPTRRAALSAVPVPVCGPGAEALERRRRPR